MSLAAPIVTFAVLGGSALVLYVYCILPALRWNMGSRPAELIAAALAIALPVGAALALVLPIPAGVVPAMWLALIGLWTYPQALIRLTGGPRPLPPEITTTLAVIDEVAAHLDVGDVEAAREVVGTLDDRSSPVLARYVTLWQRYVDEELDRRAGIRVSSTETRRAMRDEYQRLLLGRPLGRRIAWTAITLAAVLAATPAIADARACIGVETLLNADVPAAGHVGLAASLPASAEPGAELAYEMPLDLDAVAAAKADPQTRDLLTEARFIAGHERAWIAADGRGISAEVFEFRDAAGAFLYQAAVNRYACRFSTQAFRGLANGIGLQTEWGRGDPFSEQVSWVSGSRRFVVSIRFLEPPPDHSRILALAELATARD